MRWRKPKSLLIAILVSPPSPLLRVAVLVAALCLAVEATGRNKGLHELAHY